MIGLKLKLLSIFRQRSLEHKNSSIVDDEVYPSLFLVDLSTKLPHTCEGRKVALFYLNIDAAGCNVFSSLLSLLNIPKNANNYKLNTQNHC